MTPCNSDTHPSFVAIHTDPEECPACRMVLDTINVGNLRHALGSAQVTVRLLLGMVSPGEPVDVIGTGKVPEVPEKSPADSPVEPEEVPAVEPPTSTEMKAEAAEVEDDLPDEVVASVRESDSRYPSVGVDVTSWKGRAAAAGAYLGALRVAEADHDEPAEDEPTPATEAPTIEDADARLF